VLGAAAVSISPSGSSAAAGTPASRTVAVGRCAFSVLSPDGAFDSRCSIGPVRFIDTAIDPTRMIGMVANIVRLNLPVSRAGWRSPSGVKDDDCVGVSPESAVPAVVRASCSEKLVM
jgi:hypothetical protein